jgi:parallel beta-helix repeat protein
MRNVKKGGMRKLLFVIFFISTPFLINAQSNGDGSFGNPWSGTLNGNTTWSGTKYINGDVTVDNEKLTISSGSIIVFLSTTADLIITSTGQIEAIGTSTNNIRFTADFDGDGNYGETGESRGHIAFQSMGAAGSSSFDYCIFEYSDVLSFANNNPQGAGGGLFVNFDNLTISHSTFQHNKSQWGGGIFVYSDRSPSISNCYFYDNFAKESGGGVYLWDRSGSTVQNCVFYSNSCQGYSLAIYTGGGLAAQSSTSIKVINCTFANNTSSRTDGQGIMLYSSSNARIINSIFWGSSNQVYLTGTPGSTVINCAIQSVVPSGSSNCITLNSSNTALDGPNFTATDGTDWSIRYISPCREVGTSTGAPSTDFLGKYRVGLIDIGAYEVQYSNWTGLINTSWTNPSNWEASIDPASGSGDVIIPFISGGTPNYPVGTPAPDFTIGAGKIMILRPGAQATMGSLSNLGTLRLESDVPGTSSLIVSTYSGNDAEIQLFLQGGGGQGTYKWHYISTPVTSLPVSVFAPGATNNLAQWIENLPVFSLRQGWVAYDGYLYGSGGMGGPTFSSLTPGKGYNYFDDVNNTFSFSGQLNTTDAPMALGFAGDAVLHGFNLLGNPFSSGLDWNVIINDPSYPMSTSKSLYFTRDNVQCTYTNGVGIPGDVTGIIPPMQGFFTKTYATGNTINLPAAARVQGTIHPRYKGGIVIPLVRLTFAEGKLSDETVVRFDATAKSGLDYDFDAIKMFLSADIVSIYSTTSGTKYAINGIPFPETLVEIPLVVNLTKDTIHTINASQVQGLENYSVTLTDNTTGFTADLKTTPLLTFSAAAGTIAGRFILKIGTITTGTENPTDTRNTFNIYPSDGLINIQTVADEWDGKSGSVKVLDLTGKTVSDLKDAEFTRNSLIQVPAAGLKGMYVVEIRSGVKRYVGKVVVR